MFKKLLLALATLVATMGFAFADVDVNKADQAALDGVKGIGPKISKTILDERKKGGDFKDWADFEKRVHGIGEKSSAKLSQAGLTVNGQPKPNAPAAPATPVGDKKEKAASASAKTEAKVEPKVELKDSKAKDQKIEKTSVTATASAPSASASAPIKPVVSGKPASVSKPSAAASATSATASAK